MKGASGSSSQRTSPSAASVGKGFTGDDILELHAPKETTSQKFNFLLRHVYDGMKYFTDAVCDRWRKLSVKEGKLQPLPNPYVYTSLASHVGDPANVRFGDGVETPKLKFVSWEFDTEVKGLEIAAIARALHMDGSGTGSTSLEALQNISTQQWKALVGEDASSAESRYRMYPSDWPSEHQMVPYRLDLAYSSHLGGAGHTHYAHMRIFNVGSVQEPKLGWRYSDWYADQFGLSGAEVGVNLRIDALNGKVAELKRYPVKVLIPIASLPPLCAVYIVNCGG